jgi:hypothetical protein
VDHGGTCSDFLRLVGQSADRLTGRSGPIQTISANQPQGVQACR